jgi:hypothetical protein
MAGRCGCALAPAPPFLLLIPSSSLFSLSLDLASMMTATPTIAVLALALLRGSFSFVHTSHAPSRSSNTALLGRRLHGDDDNNNADGSSRRKFIDRGAAAIVAVVGGTTSAAAMVLPRYYAANAADVDTENFLKTGMVSMPMGVSGQAGKAKPVTGVVLREGSDVRRDERAGGVLAEILVGKSSNPIPVLAGFSSPWPLARGGLFDVECRDSGTGDGAFLAVASAGGIKGVADLPKSFFTDSLFSSTGRFSFYGSPTDIRVKKSDVDGSYRYLEIQFSSLSQVSKRSQVSFFASSSSSSSFSPSWADDEPNIIFFRRRLYIPVDECGNTSHGLGRGDDTRGVGLGGHARGQRHHESLEAGLGKCGQGRSRQLQGDPRSRVGDEGQGEGEGGQSHLGTY